MVISVERTDQQTLDGTSGSVATGIVNGIIKAIKIHTSASLDFTIKTTGGHIEEYVFGASGAAVTLTADTAIYPKVLATNKVDNGILTVTANIYTEVAVASALLVEVSSGTDTETWSVEIIYET